MPKVFLHQTGEMDFNLKIFLIVGLEDIPEIEEEGIQEVESWSMVGNGAGLIYTEYHMIT